MNIASVLTRIGNIFMAARGRHYCPGSISRQPGKTT